MRLLYHNKITFGMKRVGKVEVEKLFKDNMKVIRGRINSLSMEKAGDGSYTKG